MEVVVNEIGLDALFRLVNVSLGTDYTSATHSACGNDMIYPIYNEERRMFSNSYVDVRQKSGPGGQITPVLHRFFYNRVSLNVLNVEAAGKSAVMSYLTDRIFVFRDDPNQIVKEVAERFRLLRFELYLAEIDEPCYWADEHSFPVGRIRARPSSHVYLPNSYLEVVLARRAIENLKFRVGNDTFATKINRFASENFDAFL